jgi:hypothetical protein
MSVAAPFVKSVHPAGAMKVFPAMVVAGVSASSVRRGSAE